ncbi:hypothetical protein K469DRAFT_649142 [Zopfia rhizophila CBS 207.26]|uniref:Rhodopsin domain-containing protein n=1 Tax=Zopfia rhizophila CBS 207.26 TaxID=1314779 RepID=A0A6A6EVL8_9PEZI|nr:hypothetical protein K469DRAFT_649142 [Zopfia rhizophila CBS 207.26]
MAGDFPHLSLTVMSHWPKPDSIDPARRNWFPAFSITLEVLTTAVLCARLRSQITKSSGRLAVDDILACTAWLFATLFTASCIVGTMKYGFDRHMWDVPVATYDRAALVEFLAEGAFLLSTCLTKVSALCFYRRLDPPCPKALRWIIYSFIALTVVYSLAFLLYLLLLCHPISAYWKLPDPTHPTQRSCASQRISYPLQGSLSSFSAYYTILIPALVLRNIPMSKSQRLGLRAISLVGLIVVGTGITRTVFLVRMVNSTNGDATWNGFNIFVWSQLECQLSLICASVPFLQRYFSQYPSAPILYISRDSKERNDSVISRVSSSLSGQIKRTLHIRRSSSPRQASISMPQPVEIPEWEFETLQSSSAMNSPVDIDIYDRYLAGKYGPPPPPKDSKDLFDQYRREHGELV